MAEKFTYDTSAATRDVPLRQDEVDALILNQGKVLVKDEKAVVHLLHRIAATLRDHRAKMSGLQQDVHRIKGEKEVRTQPLARAIEAVSVLDDDERTALLDAGYLAEVDRVKKAHQELEMARMATLNEGNRVRFALASLLQDDSIPTDVRQKIADTMGRLGGQ